MEKKLIVPKGYTLEVVSWENDGDYYNTKQSTVETLELAKAVHGLMLLCVSKNNHPKGVIRLGNSYESFSEEQEELIVEYFLANPVLKHWFSDVDPNIEMDKRLILDLFHEIKYSLLGGSEYYACRVMESCTVTYSAEDIYADIITF